jgi:Sulfotransferase domain
MFSTSAHVEPDVLYIGYPKAASTFVSHFLESHPEVTTDRDRLSPLLCESSIARPHSAIGEKPRPNKIHVSIDEMVAISVCLANEEKWKNWRLIPGTWDKVKDDVLLDPTAAALRLQKMHSRARVLLLIREQSDWLHSAYKHFLRHLPGTQRTFADFCATPQGIAMLQAGHFDETIRAYIDVFGSERVHALRYEDLAGAPKLFTNQLCAFVGISERPIPQGRENESHAQVARIRRRFPIIDQLPIRIKSLLKPLAARFPGKRGLLLSSRELLILRSLYATSNQRTDKLLSQLSTKVNEAPVHPSL